jgi:copper(I)-binding protein
MTLNNKIYSSTIILSLIISIFSKTYADTDDINIDGFIIKNPHIVYKDVNTKIAAGYFEIENTNNFDEKLMFVTGDISNRIEIHNTKMDDGVMKMYKIDNGIYLKKKNNLKFEPGKYHLMIMDIKEKITNDKYILSLYFQKLKKRIDINFKTISMKNKIKMAH